MMCVLMSGVLPLAAAVWVGCAEPAFESPTATTHSSHFGQKPVRLEDGRRVSVRFTEEGLVERHQSAEGRPWSKPRVLYSEAGDRECTVDLSTYRNTVTVVARYYPGCYADSEPKVMIVAVSDGDLDDWDEHHSAGWLSWDDAPPRFSLLGQRVVFGTGKHAGAEELSRRRTSASPARRPLRPAETSKGARPPPMVRRGERALAPGAHRPSARSGPGGPAAHTCASSHWSRSVCTSVLLVSLRISCRASA